MGDEFLTSIDYVDEFHVNLLFDRSIYRPMCTHMIMGYSAAKILLTDHVVNCTNVVVLLTG